tara:strand:- start:46 stop:390 length:345 start_codon:yes stop_codon:yes gene_type:complete
MDIFKRGTLVKITVDGVEDHDVGWAIGGMHPTGMGIYEQISIHSYPSCDDFFGKETIVFTGNVATIIKYIGRPCRINPNPEFFKYDIYEILINGDIRQIFRFNIEKIKEQDFLK